MHNAEAAIEPAFYDHEDETVQRDRVAADWGADEVFATVPRRRFRGDHHGPATLQRRGTHSPAPAEDAVEAERRAAWLAEVEAELSAPAPAPAAIEVAPAEEVVLTDGVEFAEPIEAGGRRTVTITGRPEGAPPAPRPMPVERRRPARTVDERIGGRPDRVAGWAFGMGILLIVIAAIS
jgi:hypothetical protein